MIFIDSSLLSQRPVNFDFATKTGTGKYLKNIPNEIRQPKTTNKTEIKTTHNRNHE